MSMIVTIICEDESLIDVLLGTLEQDFEAIVGRRETKIRFSNPLPPISSLLLWFDLQPAITSISYTKEDVWLTVEDASCEYI